MVLVLYCIPLITLLFFLLGKNNGFLHAISIVSSGLLLLIAVCLTRTIITADSISQWGSAIYIDALSIIMLDIVLLVSFIASLYSIAYLDEEVSSNKIEPRRIKTYYLLMDGFIFTMIVALTANNMGIMWIAIEATTLASVFLVGFYNHKKDLEAAWKYVIICSVGIALAMLGIILLHLASVIGVSGFDSLNWTVLFANAATLKPGIIKLAFVFILVGFGTKAGLAPMHTWLPDAHSQAPSPISALLSGVLLNSAMYGIIRSAAIVNKNLGSSSYTGTLLIVLGLLSMLTAAVFMLTQKDYKRTLAYSSIEHMGLISIAIGLFTPAAVFAGILHMINHSLTKSMLFFSSGNIYLKYQTKEIAGVKGVLKLLPVSGTIFLLGLFAIAGLPPFSIFTSEFSIIASLFARQQVGLGIIIILLLAVVFVGLAMTMLKMFYGTDLPAEVQAGEANRIGNAALLLILFIITGTGLYWPHGFSALILQAQRVIMGG